MEHNDLNKISISGDLSMVGVTEQLPLLAHYLAAPVEADTAGSCQDSAFEIDLTGVEAIDACGCQLLAAFVHTLKKRGAQALSFKLSDSCREIIHTLGFDDELFARGCA